MARNILVVEDDRDIAHLIELHLRDSGYSVTTVFDGRAGLDKAVSESFDLIILDIMLPYVDGLDICRKIRESDRYTPTLMLTSRTSETDRVLGLEMGADDYLTKPFSMRELIARVKALIRRVETLRAERNAAALPVIKIGNLIIEPDKRKVTRDGEDLQLTAKEFDLLLYFARHPGLVHTRSQLLSTVWGYAYEGYEHTVNSHINRLRAKIEANPARPSYILTVRGVGYKFSEQIEHA